jgi:hypothetical protein
MTTFKRGLLCAAGLLVMALVCFPQVSQIPGQMAGFVWDYTNTRLGIGITPVDNLHVNASATIGGIRISGAVDNSGINLVNTGTGGRHWALMNASGSSGAGQGNIGLYDVTAGYQVRHIWTLTGESKQANWGYSWSGTNNDATAAKDLRITRNAAGVLRIDGGVDATGGGLLIEGLKSTSGTRFVCVDTTGRITSSASQCSGT